MTDNANSLVAEFRELEGQLADPRLLEDQQRYRTVMRRWTELRPLVAVTRELDDVRQELAEAEPLLSDPELKDMAREEVDRLEKRRQELEDERHRLLLPRDPFDSKNVILEVRAAAGGDEASLFAAELLDMYRRYAATLGYAVEVLDSHPTDVGGLTRVSAEIRGDGAYSHFKFESGVHRVQRVPETESQGRIHTSTVTVAVLPEADDVDVNLSPSDYRVDVYRSSGPGGQSVNTTDSAVRVTSQPGQDHDTLVACQEGKTQTTKRGEAPALRRPRLLECGRVRPPTALGHARLLQIGSDDGSENISTHNFPH